MRCPSLPLLAAAIVAGAFTTAAAAPEVAAATAAASFTSGLIPVNKNSSIFYWYCPPTTLNRTAAAAAPIILWLQGGPGASGLVGALFEMGPYKLEKKANASSSEGLAAAAAAAAGGGGGVNSSSAYALVDRAVGAWTDKYGVLFVDSPVGTGFSVAGGPEAYSRTEEEVADNLWLFLQGFYAQYPELLARGFYVMGESYGGHYCPAAAYYFLRKNDEIPPSTPAPTPPPSAAPTAPSRLRGQGRGTGVGGAAHGEGPVRIPLKGVAIGDGLTNPALQVMSKARVAYDMGLLNGKEFLQARGLALRASLAAMDGQYAEAREYREQLEAYIEGLSGINLYDVRTFDGYDFEEVIADWAADPMTKARFNLPQTAAWKSTDEYAAAAGDALKDDLMVSYAPQVAAILDTYKLPVMLYQGQFDLKDGPVSNQAWIRSLRWTGQQGYLNATRVQWWADVPSSTPTSTSTSSTNERAPAGWVQKYGLLTEAVVAGAGHLAPMDQPARAFDMVVRFIEGKPWGKEEGRMEGMEEGGVEAPAVAVAAE